MKQRPYDYELISLHDLIIEKDRKPVFSIKRDVKEEAN